MFYSSVYILKELEHPGDCDCTEIREGFYKPTYCPFCNGEEGCPMFLIYIKFKLKDYRPQYESVLKEIKTKVPKLL
jgi:hypothetical protein